MAGGSDGNTTGVKRPRRRAFKACLQALQAPDDLGESSNTLTTGSQQTTRVPLDALPHYSHVLLVTGAGVSHPAGVPTFTDSGKQAWYGKAKKKFKLSGSGKRMFSYAFFAKYRDDATSFFNEMAKTVRRATPTEAHKSVAHLRAAGRLLRNYTLNVDNLDALVDSQAIYPRRCDTSGTVLTKSPKRGDVVQLHGNVLETVCETCSTIATLAYPPPLNLSAPCSACGACDSVRHRIMLYDEKAEEAVLGAGVGSTMMRQLAEDAKSADVVAFVGLSFEQSASVEYYRKVRRAAIPGATRLLVVNPDGGLAASNVASATSFDTGVEYVDVTADEFLAHLLNKDVNLSMLDNDAQR